MGGLVTLVVGGSNGGSNGGWVSGSSVGPAVKTSGSSKQNPDRMKDEKALLLFMLHLLQR